MTKVLIVYGTTEGHTARIAQRIADLVRAQGYEAEAMDVGKTSANLDPCDGVILGSSIHMGEHEKRIRAFARQNRAALETLPSAFFSVSITAAEDTEEAHAKVEEYVEKFEDETGWKPGTVAVFAGALAYTRYGFIKRRMVKSIAKEKHLDHADTSRDYEYTDWEEVRRFTEEFMGATVHQPVPEVRER